MASDLPRPAARRSDASRELYLRWIAANGLGELVGLGGTFAVVAAALPAATSVPGLAGVLLAFVLLVGSGAFEATVLAALQQRVLRHALPGVTLGRWWRATLIGALLAYLLGYLPSTLMEAAETTGAVPVTEPPQWVVLLLAGALGAVAGAILSAFQAAALRRATPHAWRWIPANMAAWAVGMPVIFVGMDLAFRTEVPVTRVAVIAVALAVAGIVVGAVHGRTLIGFVRAGR